MNTTVRAELLRKSLHLLITLCPLLVFLAGMILNDEEAGRCAIVALLAFGIVLYTILETLRIRGIHVPLVSFLTERASRARDSGFVKGPVTLGLGALLALLLFPIPIAYIAVYALGFGDGLSSLAGRFFGRLRPAFLRGKSVEGSAVCFAAVALAAFLVSRSLATALTAASAATITEALPLKDWDNLAIPLATGAALCILAALTP